MPSTAAVRDEVQSTVSVTPANGSVPTQYPPPESCWLVVASGMKMKIQIYICGWYILLWLVRTVHNAHNVREQDLALAFAITLARALATLAVLVKIPRPFLLS